VVKVHQAKLISTRNGRAPELRHEILRGILGLAEEDGVTLV